ncbi:MAG: hypothetical protein AAB857_03330 [Patescibacteria group bacterium]
MPLMSTIRLVVNDELRKTLDFLRVFEYPTLTDAELVKVAISREVIRAKKTRETLDYDDSDLNPKELLFQAAKSFEMEDEGEKEVFWNESNLKPLKLKNYV